MQEGLSSNSNSCITPGNSADLKSINQMSDYLGKMIELKIDKYRDKKITDSSQIDLEDKKIIAESLLQQGVLSALDRCNRYPNRD